MTWLQTHQRKRFDVLSPRPEDVDIADIAHSLSLLCRFNGHTRTFYSVAQHSIYVSQVVEQDHPEEALVGLMHDAAEAYLGDMVRPLKVIMPEYCELERRVERAIAIRFGLLPSMSDVVKRADDRVLAAEVRDLLGGDVGGWSQRLPDPCAEEILPWEWYIARDRFLARFNVLRQRRRGDSKRHLAGAEMREVTG